ncbi:ComEC/Rec2 family competence protein [Agrobacterium tumefaciens]|uniref:ComEC/Rec2 family competence protein n=1 Tax=Agrobacterium tumefaciens TaxID=358 RepID=UPI00287E2ED8|nr:ComEC/Rec2 family competence protein [Agrobacterium tumefaciens]MDS7596917.1 ComEC family competence protein [Agrobacterium tumefaciens]
MQGSLPGTAEIIWPLRRSSDTIEANVATSLAPQTHRRTISQVLAASVPHERAFGHDFLFIPVFVGAGAVLWFSLEKTPPSSVLSVLFLMTVGLALLFRYRSGLAATVFAAAAFMLLGMGLADIETRRAGTIMLDTPVVTTITGTIGRREVDARGQWRYIIDVSATQEPRLSRPPERVSILSRGGAEGIAVGDIIQGKARLSPPSGPALPGLNDFAFASYFRGIGATGFFYAAPKALSSTPEGVNERGSWLQQADRWLYLLRSAIADRIRSVIGGDAGAFAASIVTDERHAISAATMEALRVSGLAHIVAISGLNMALASGIFFVGLRIGFSLFPAFAQRWPVKKIAAFMALLMTLAYYLISGFAVSAERAWLMMSVMLIAILFDKPSLSLRNVALSAFIILAVSPSEVMGPSFQMSFAATIALVSAYAFWSRWRVDRERLFVGAKPAWMSVVAAAATVVGGVVVTSLIGGLSTAVYSIEHFHRVTTYGLAANLAAMPVMSLIVMPFALIGMLLMPFGLDAPFLKVMGYGMALVIEIANGVASWGGSAAIGRQQGWFLIIATAGFLLLALLRTRLALAGVPFVVVAIAMTIAEYHRPKPDLLIFEDGGLVALVEDNAVAATKARPTGFVYEQWKRALLLPDRTVSPKFLPLSENAGSSGNSRRLSEEERSEAFRDIAAAVAHRGEGFTCQRGIWCAVHSGKGQRIVVLEDPTLAGGSCDIADIIVTSRGTSFQDCRSGAILFSQNILRRLGSVEITLGEGNSRPIANLRSAMAGTDRPWSEHRFYEWKSRAFHRATSQTIEKLMAAR